MKSVSRKNPSLRSVAAAARRFPSPENYFSGRRRDEALLPDNILCFHRGRPVHDPSGHEGISTASGKYDQHDRFVLIFCLREGGTIGVETNRFVLAEGDALLVFPHQLHYYLDLPERFCWFYITFELPEGAHEAVAGLREGPRRLDDTALENLRATMNAYRQGESADALETALSLRRVLLALCQAPASLSSSETESAEENDEHLVREIKRYVYGHLDADLSLATISRHMNLSESYLRARFRERMGISLWQFILAVRVTRAAHLLRTSSSRIAEVGAACGFDSQHSFTRAFKRAFTVTPRQYRNREA